MHLFVKKGIPLTTLHRDKKKLSIEGKLPESFRVKDRTENSEYEQKYYLKVFLITLSYDFLQVWTTFGNGFEKVPEWNVTISSCKVV